MSIQVPRSFLSITLLMEEKEILRGRCRRGSPARRVSTRALPVSLPSCRTGHAQVIFACRSTRRGHSDAHFGGAAETRLRRAPARARGSGSRARARCPAWHDDRLAVPGPKMLVGAHHQHPRFHLRFRWRAARAPPFWSPSKSALKAEQTSGWSWMACLRSAPARTPGCRGGAAWGAIEQNRCSRMTSSRMSQTSGRSFSTIFWRSDGGDVPRSSTCCR